MSQQKGMSFKEFRQRFQTEEACEAYLFEQRWPDGFVCSKCGGTGCYRLRGHREYVCKHCYWQCLVTAGTVLHRTHLLLTIWFWAIYLAARDKRGISATQFSRELEIAYSSAWYLLRRLRKAMGQRDQDYVLSGIVELDDAYFSAPKSNGKRGRGAEKTSALATVSLTSQGHLCFLRFFRKSCVNADKQSSRKQEQIKGLPRQGTAQLNRAYPPVFRDEGRYARAA